MEEYILLPPYWWIEYIDDYGQKHIATVKNEEYLNFIESRYIVLVKKAVAAS